MTFDRRSLLALPIAAGAAPQAFAQSRPVAPYDIPVWPPAEHFLIWPVASPGAPTPIAPIIPMFWAPDAVPRITLTRPRVSTASIRNASDAEYPDAG